jgi:mannobiose 2-epimerase
MKRFVAILSLLIFSTTLASRAAEPPTAARLREQALQCRQILSNSLVDFYLPNCLDRTSGGYKENLNEHGDFTLTGEKFLTLQARQVWFFSTLALEGIDHDRSLEAAKHGFTFIYEKMRDKQKGGYFSKVTDEGQVKDARKHAYLNAFALYAFGTYRRASNDRNAFGACVELFSRLDHFAHDNEHGGYIEFFNPDWTEVTNSAAGGYVGAIGVKTYNTHLHLMEAMTEYYRSVKDPTALQRLNELLDININTVLYPTVNANVDAFHRDWTVVNEPNNLRASYGHDIECLWLVIDAARFTGRSASIYRTWAEKLGANIMKYGYDRDNGGLFESGPLDKPADKKQKTWWVQAEALVGFLQLYELTGKPEYYEAFSKTLDFCAKYQVAKEGGWWATRNTDGSPAPDKTRTSMWQGGYHAGRSMLECSHRLEALAKSAK